MQQLSLTARLTLFFTSLSCIVLLSLGWLIGASIDAHFKEQDHHALSGKLELAQHIIERVNSEQEVRNLADQLSDALVGHHDLAITILDKQGQVILASETVKFPAEYLQRARSQTSPTLFSWDANGDHYRGLVSVFTTKDPQYAPITVAIATDIAHHQEFMASFRKTLWLFVFVAAALTSVLAWFAASRGLRPLRIMRERAAKVTANKLDQRLPLESVPPELADLAQSLNQMLARLEEAFQRLSDFSSDLAHELRTPISNLMTQTQVSLSQARDAQSYREILESNAEEYSRLARMIADMLFLAKAENGLSLANVEAVDIVRELRDLFEFYEALADEKTIRFDLQIEQSNAASWVIRGDRLMLRRALSNILSNALRYTSEGNSIQVHLQQQTSCIELKICNPGSTIPAHHLSRLFERFYRVDHARQHADGEGSGLGLAIVKAIIDGHRGQISASSENQLTCFTIHLPQQN
ncbi:heavy metal sensor histidine kinase [Undibacterium macrobrachii]|uniref:Sensor protein n=1 Tax=Undibacterium macrobrachii TaxID=1119058 RepID=A0ABQ2X9S0_9BURK|nr:heavy metal sensor histidine kinase [Undibacterium macrobrachii]GGX06095.1 two-component sensor histidine kinase [Undibacterium macrobrachii]